MSAGQEIGPLFDLTIWGSVAAALGLAIHALMRRRSAAARHLVVLGFLTGMLALPIVLFSGRTVELAILPPVELDRAEPAGSTNLPDVVAVSPEAALSEAAMTRSSTSLPPSERLPSPLIVLYIAGVLATCAPLAAGFWKVSRTLRTAVPLDRRTSALPEDAVTLVSEEVRAPFVWGWLRPVLVLPGSSVSWSEATLENVLQHEVAHLERRDGLSQIVGRIATAMHWYNPLAWLLMKRLLLEAERASDDRVLASGTSAAAYAERLLTIASRSGRRFFLDEVAAVAMARPSQLATRIETLLDERSRRWKLPLWQTLIVIALTSATLSAAALVRFEPARAPLASPASAAEGSDQGWVEVDSSSLTLRPGVTAIVIGKGKVHLENDKRTLRWDEPVEMAIGSESGSSIKIWSDSELWFVVPATVDIDNVRGTRIRDVDPNASSRVQSSDGIQFYLAVDRQGRGMFVEPEDGIDPDFDLDFEFEFDGDEWDDVDPDWNFGSYESRNYNTNRNRNYNSTRSRSSDDGWEDDSDGEWNDESGWDDKPRKSDSYNARLSADESSLYPAIRYGRVEAARNLIESGYSPNEIWEGDGTPLIVAVRNGDRRMVEMLLDYDADPTLGVEGDGNALIVAAQHGELDLLELLVEAGGDINVGIEGDGSPLIAAARHGHIRILEYLLREGADIEKVVPGDENALMSASEAGRLDAVKLLVSRGADVNARVRVDRWGTNTSEVRTALSQAQKNGHDDVVAYLRSVGARR